MVVAIIDDGICKEEISAEVEIHLVGKYKNRNFKQMDRESHGTVCAKIIEKYSSPDKIIDIPFLDGTDSAKLSDMCEALEYCSGLNVDIINLSCGSAFYNENTDEYRRLYSVCRQLYHRGVKIFAAQNNRGNLTIPANFPYVTSVERCGSYKHKMVSLYRKSDIIAESKHSIILNGKRKKTDVCNSYACAYASACEVAGKIAFFKKLVVSDSISADLTLYRSKFIRENIYELYLDDIPKAIGRLYFHKFPETERKYIKKNSMNFLVLRDSDNDVGFISKCAKVYCSSELPFVFIKKNERSMETAMMLNSKFISNMYKSNVVSSDMSDSFFGAIYSPSRCVEDFAKIFAKYNSSNIMIVICSMLNINNSDDVYVVIEHNGYTLYYNGMNKYVETADMLYNEIIDLF